MEWMLAMTSNTASLAHQVWREAVSTPVFWRPAFAFRDPTSNAIRTARHLAKISSPFVAEELVEVSLPMMLSPMKMAAPL
jgi:hypothetical protein